MSTPAVSARARRPRPVRRKWPVCQQTGKQRLGERKDVKLALEAARHTRAAVEVADRVPTWTVVRGYRCEHCGGWHLTSRPTRTHRGQPQPHPA
jgi:hypothetical protein